LIFIKNKLGVLENRNKNFVLNFSLVYYIITRVLFIGHKERSEKIKLIKLHYLVGREWKRYGHPLILNIHNTPPWMSIEDVPR
jgi:hypothetical protein